MVVTISWTWQVAAEKSGFRAARANLRRSDSAAGVSALVATLKGYSTRSADYVAELRAVADEVSRRITEDLARREGGRNDAA